uniref:Uncharacterized protein n=1 Tax=Nelumbo nucifera TaxID=4432 RepID=A0A822ZBG7_NELNU|nr:TPA_asm: hypothetical protein HUJ06_014709 [Nelumbo nucifera]
MQRSREQEPSERTVAGKREEPASSLVDFQSSRDKIRVFEQGFQP